LEVLKVYPWKLCEAVVDGVQLLKEATAGVRRNVHLAVIQAYPTASTDTDDAPSASEAATTMTRGGRGCAACNASMRKDSPLHTREPMKCLHPHVKPVYWECPACQDERQMTYRNSRSTDAGHTRIQGQCKFVGKDVGKAPREPKPIQTTHPSAEASGLDASMMETVGEEVPPAYGEGSASASSTGPHEADARGRGRPYGSTDAEPRTRRTWTDTGSGATRLPDWTRFSVQVSLRNLRSYEPTVVMKELRKLHLRWWHAREPKMRTILQAAGVDAARLAFIKPIVDTCRECRAWQRRGNVITPTVEIITKFNQVGETDLFFYKKHIGFHIIDRAIRLSDGCEVANKETETLLDAYWTTWVQREGGFETLYSDGEMGLNNPTAIAELKRLGTKLQVRAPGQHAQLAESRQAMLRHVMHMIEEELKRHNTVIPFKRLYGEALFVVNAFSFYNGVSPYNAHKGRQPAFLPDLENLDFPKGGELSDGDREARIRAAGIEAITQSTAVAKINRSLVGKTTPNAANLYKPGDLIDYHRPTQDKDDHGGWNGPLPVTRNDPDRGQVVIHHGNREILVRYPDARLTLFIEAIFMGEVGMDNDAMDIILIYVSRLQAGKTPEVFGYFYVDGKYNLTTASKKAPKVYMALQYVIRNFFRIQDVFAVRLGKSVHRVGKCEHAEKSTLIYYTCDNAPDFHYYETEDTALDIQYITQNNSSRFIQCLVKTGCQLALDENVEVTQQLMPTRPTAEVERRDAPPQQDEGPPTPVNLEGNLPTIYEDDEERELDSMVLETFYAELTDSDLLEEISNCEDEHRNVHPVQMMPENTVLMTVQSEDAGYDQETLYLPDMDSVDETIGLEFDEIGTYIEICVDQDMAMMILEEEQWNGMTENDIATIRVYVSANAKKAVVVKEDDLLTKKDFTDNVAKVAEATVAELSTWLQNNCFKLCLLKNAQNVMTSRYVAKWKQIKDPSGKQTRVIRMRMCLRGFMDTEAFTIDTFSGTAKRQSQRLLASEAACNPHWIIASLDVDKAFLKGFTYKELAELTGEAERTVCFKLPPGSAALLRKFPGYENYDESIHCLQCIKPGTGTKDAPRAFSLKLRKTTQSPRIGLKPTSFDPELEVKKNLLTAKHVDDVNMAGTEPLIDAYHAEVEKVFGSCKINKHQFTNCGVRYTMQDNHDVVMDQDVYIATMRPVVHRELTGAAAEREATKAVADMFVSLRGALAYTTLTQAWIQVYIVSLQRVQAPTNLEVRRLNAVTRKLQQAPGKLIFKAMVCSRECDIHTDSGYRRVEVVDDVKGYGMRGLCLLRRGVRPNTKEQIVHLLESICKSHRLTIRSSYGAELLAAVHGIDDVFPSLISMVEIRDGCFGPKEIIKIREEGGLALKVTLTMDAESVYKSVISRDMKAPTEKTLLGHVWWLRELLQIGVIDSVQWCDTRDMTADGHTKGSIDRKGLLEVMHGFQVFKHDLKKHTPHRGGKTLGSA